MFNFFRKSKKDDTNGSKKSKEKENRETKESHSPMVDGKKMCKNTQPLASPEPKNDADPMPNSLPPDFVLRKNVNATNTSEVATLHCEKNDPVTSNMCDSSPANMLKFPEQVRDNKQSERRGSCVKPCGHGTTAITPWVPLHVGTKRDSPSTPPGSPVSEIKKPFKPSNELRQDTSGSTNEAILTKINGEQDDSNTITASMKLHVNLPITTNEKASVENEQQEKKNLINQEAKFQSQLNDLSKQLAVRDAEANKLRFQMEELQRDVFSKAAGMDRLQAELNAATKESEIIRQRIRHLENDLDNYRAKNGQLTEELQDKTEHYSNLEQETKEKIEELENIIKGLHERIETLEKQINQLKEEKEQLQKRHGELLVEREEETKLLAETIGTATKQKEEIEKKWKEDFEKLRTVNILKEQQLLDDFEWKLREVQQSCKKRLQDKDRAIEERLQEAYKEAEIKMKEAEDKITQVETLKSYEIEVEHLRGLTTEQQKAMKEMMEQHSQVKQAEETLKSETKRLRNLIEMEKENLQHMQLIHHQELMDKERKLKETLNQKRTEIAMYWEERLIHECGRLKNELEQIHNEEKYMAMQHVRREKDEQFEQKQAEWEKNLKDCLREIGSLKKALKDKDEYYHEEIVRTQSNTDRDIMELRRLMNKIDMVHHDNYEKLVREHETEIEKINQEHEKKLIDVETHWQNQVSSLKTTEELVKEQMENEAQQKIESLIQQHRDELDSQWDNLIKQKSESMELVKDEYVNKYKTLEEQFLTQQKSHSSREIELLKTIDSLKNELESKESTIDDLQNNVDTLEGGVQVLNQEIAQQGEQLVKHKKESDQKIRGLQETVAKLREGREKEREVFRQKLMSVQKQSQESIDHLQRKCQCLTKLFEEVRQRYERRESRQEDINIISDLKQVIAEQEKDLACINEEKRYFQMRLMQLERHLESQASEEEYEDAPMSPKTENVSQPIFQQQNGPIFIPPTIPECDE